MTNVLICDNNPIFADYLKQEVLSIMEEPCTVSVCHSPEELRAECKNGCPQIALLDIHLNDTPENGIALAKELFPAGCGTSVIYITGYIEYVSDVYETEHIYFLRKPVEKDPAITPASLRNLLEMYRLRQIKNSLWFVMIAMFIFTKILTDYSLSTSWCVFLGTVAVFMIVYVLYKMQKWLINNASPFEDVPKKILNEWLSREFYTEEEQGL